MSVLAEPRPERLTIRPLQPTIGAEISGIDLREPLNDAVRDQIKETLLQYKVVFFRDQDIDRQQQEAFAARFGPLYNDYPNESRPDAQGSAAVHRIAAERAKERAHLYDNTWDGYHSDTSWRLVPSWGAVLRAVDLPPVGGDTIWVDAGLAYEGLSDDVKERLEGLFVVHDFRVSLNAMGFDYPLVSHPAVRVHRETGKKILWVDYSKRPSVIGLDPEESKAILTLIIDQYRKPEYQVRFSWRPGSVAFWDNRAAVHYAVRNYGDFPRLLERVLILDEPQYQDL